MAYLCFHQQNNKPPAHKPKAASNLSFLFHSPIPIATLFPSRSRFPLEAQQICFFLFIFLFFALDFCREFYLSSTWIIFARCISPFLCFHEKNIFSIINPLRKSISSKNPLKCFALLRCTDASFTLKIQFDAKWFLSRSDNPLWAREVNPGSRDVHHSQLDDTLRIFARRWCNHFHLIFFLLLSPSSPTWYSKFYCSSLRIICAAPHSL